MRTNPVTVAEKVVVLSAQELAMTCDLADALETRFGGVVARDADTIARFVVLWIRTLPAKNG